jgi:phosphatidylglycerol:prolipoprotein diacylglycerol transferase
VNLRRGELFLSYLVWYSIGRFFIEGMRTDSLMLTAHLRIAQVMSIALIVIAVGLWIVRRVKGLSQERYFD